MNTSVQSSIPHLLVILITFMTSLLMTQIAVPQYYRDNVTTESYDNRNVSYSQTSLSWALGCCQIFQTTLIYVVNNLLCLAVQNMRVWCRKTFHGRRVIWNYLVELVGTSRVKDTRVAPSHEPCCKVEWKVYKFVVLPSNCKPYYKNI